MYKLSVPFLLEQIDKYGAEPFIEKMKVLEADIVFLAIGAYHLDVQKQASIFASLKKNIPLFKAAGFTVGVWLWTFMVQSKNDFVHITSPNGRVSHDEVCPSDANFCEFAYNYLHNIAECAPDIILFDDDFRYGFLDCGLGCTCKNHRAYISKLVSEDVSEKELAPLVFGGSKNKYRTAFLQANGHFFREFAKVARAAVDSVDREIRLGLCACMTTWDFDGVSAAELSRILAGSTKPFLRLIGAPYWAHNRSWGNRLQDVVELERMESSWCGDDIEILAEGDAFPRPRFTCSANMLDGFDMALRASGATDGIHKYPLDYSSDVNYEFGYIRKHLKNRPIYEQIEKHFGTKTAVGVRVSEHMKKFEDMCVPSHLEGKDAVQDTFFSPAARMLAAHSIPSVYSEDGVATIAFGENAKYLDEKALSNGLILDLGAAKILSDSGIDVGLCALGSTAVATEEYFPEKHRYINLMGCPVSEITVSKKAAVQSYFIFGDQKLVGSYTYENENGQKFLVFAFDGYQANEHAIKQYERGDQIRATLRAWGKRLPVELSGNPDCYVLAKKNEGEMAVWIGNFFTDECMNTIFVLDDDYNEITFIGCSGTLNKNQVTIDEIAPFASVGFVVKKAGY